MKTKNDQNSEQKSNKNSSSQSPKINEVKTASNDKNSKIIDSKRFKKYTEPTKIIIVDDKSKDNNPVIANILSGLALVLAAFVFGFTYLLFEETKSANKISKDALKLSREQFEQSRIKDSENALENTKANSRDSLRYVISLLNDKKRFKLDSISTRTQIESVLHQIKTLKETQKEFELESRPYIQIFNANLDTFEIGKRTYISYAVINVGKFPAKIISNQGGLAYSITEDSSTIFKEFDKQYLIQGYEGIAAHNSILNANGVADEVLTEKIYNQVKTGYKAVYMYGKIKYISDLTNDVYEYIYEFKFNINPKEFKTVINSNIRK
ncbi:MAG: hypothetical protein V4683_02500 [Bacteroidota bacterium]